MTKKELKQIRDLNRELKKWQGKLDELRCQSLTNSPQWDIVPAGGGNSDKVSDIAVDIMRTEDVIKDLKAKIMLQERYFKSGGPLMLITNAVQTAFPENNNADACSSYYSEYISCWNDIYCGRPQWATVNKSTLSSKGKRTISMLNTGKVLCDYLSDLTFSEQCDIKAVGEIIDGYDAAGVPDNLVADRLDSAGYSLARTIDEDGASVLLAEGMPFNAAEINVDNAYATIIEVRKEMSKANVPNDGRRYLLATPDFYALLLKDKEHFVGVDGLAADKVASGAIGKIAGFHVYEWNDDTANLAFIAGHPKFATRVNEWQVPVKLEDLKDGKHIGASWVNGRMVYAHKVLRPVAIRNVFCPGSLEIAFAAGSANGSTIAAVSAGNTGTTYAYKVNPASRAKFSQTTASYGGTTLTSGTTEITAAVGDVVEIVNLSSGKVVAVGEQYYEAYSEKPAYSQRQSNSVQRA